MKLPARVTSAFLLSCVAYVGCSPPVTGEASLVIAAEGELSSSGDPVRLRVTATAADGTIGAGDVSLESSAGSLRSATSATLDAYGRHSTPYDCSELADPECKTRVTITATWKQGDKLVARATKALPFAEAQMGATDGGVLDVFVSSHDTDAIIQYRMGPDGRLMSWQYVVRPGSSAKLHWPHGLAFGTSNDLYVASSSETRIQRYALSNGSLLGEYVDGSLNRPISVLASSGTTLFVTVLVGRFIARLDRASGAWGTRIMDPLLGRPGAALLSQQGDMVVANDEANTVLRVNVQTGVVRSFITMPTGHVPGGLLEVSGNRLLVSDSAEGRVLSFDATTGAFQRQLFRVHPDFRDHPVAMDNGIPGEVLVCDYAANAVVRFDAATGARRGDLVPTAHASGLRGPSWVLVRARQ